MVQTGKFREDLYFRLRVVVITLPPLRERQADVPLLAQAFLKEFAAENGKRVLDFTPDAMTTLLGYPWPGNVRELRTAIEHAVVLSRSERISVRDLPGTVRGQAPEFGGGLRVAPPLTQAALTVKDAEKQLIIRALKEAGSNRSAAAQQLGMSRRTLHRKLHAYQLEDL